MRTAYIGQKGDQRPFNKKLTGDRSLMAYIKAIAIAGQSLRGPVPDNILQETGVSWQISKLADKEKGDQHPFNKLTGHGIYRS